MDSVQAVNTIRTGIVQISFMATDLSDESRKAAGSPFIRSVLGTGFFVNADGYVITAHHVLEGGRLAVRQVQAGQKELHVGLAQPNTENMRGNFTLVGFDVVDEDARHDLALLKLRQNPFEGEVRSGMVIGGEDIPVLYGVVTLDLSRPSDGAAVASSGYPLGQPVLVTSAGCMATSWASDIQEVTVPGAPSWFKQPNIADTYLADIEVNPGNSGGPVYLVESGAAVGVCVASMSSPIWNQEGKPVEVEGQQLFYSSGLTMVVPVAYVVEVLEKHGLKWLTESKS